MTTVPLMFLALDGVVRTADPADDRQLVVADVDGMPVAVFWSPGIVDAINSLHREGLAEVRWLSTWQQDVLDVARAIGLDEFTAYDIPVEETGRWYKAEIIDRVVTDEARPFVWADTGNGVDRHGNLDAALVHPHLMLTTEHETGLTLDNVTRAREFLEQARAGTLPDRVPHPARPVVFLGDGTVLLDLDSDEGIGVEIEMIDGTSEFRIDVDTIDRLAALQQAHDLDVRWISDRKYQAQYAVESRDLTISRTHVDPHDNESPMSWWKGSVVIQQVLTDGRPIVWIDCGIEEDVIESFDSETNVLLVGPSGGTLSPEELDRIEWFLVSLGEGARTW